MGSLLKNNIMKTKKKNTIGTTQGVFSVLIVTAELIHCPDIFIATKGSDGNKAIWRPLRHT